MNMKLPFDEKAERKSSIAINSKTNNLAVQILHFL